MLAAASHRQPSCALRGPLGRALPITIFLFAAPAAAAPALRIAVGVEHPRQIALPDPPGPHGAALALAFGIRDACVNPSTGQLRTTPVTCKPLGDVPSSGVCVEQSNERTLATEIQCSPGDLTAEALDLGRSGCDASACYEVEARRAGATHLLTVDGTWQDGGFTVTGHVSDLRDGSVRPFGPNDFASTYNTDWPRTGPQVLGLLKWLARAETGRRLLEHAESTRTVGKGGGGGLLTAPVPGPAVPAPVETRSSHAWLGWSLIAAGVAAGVASGIVWSMNGDLRDCDGSAAAGDPQVCRRRLRTIGPSAVLGVAALGGLAAGAIVLIKDRRGRGDLSLILHPSSVTVGGTF